MLDTYHKSGECLYYHQSIDEDISSENNLIFEEETDTRCKAVEYKRYYNDERDVLLSFLGHSNEKKFTL